MTNNPLKVIAGAPDKPLRIGETDIECFVLDDESRVLTRASVLRAIGRASKAYASGVADLADFLTPESLTLR